MKKIHPLFALVVLFSVSAKAQLFGPTGIDPSFCEQKTFRSTVVYVDDMLMRDGQIAWANSIAEKLRATLTPGERVSVVQLSPAQGSSQQIWTACWPDYNKEKRAEISQKNYFFSGNPLETIKKQQSFFLSQLGVALGKIYEAGKGRWGNGADGSGKKAIVEALASDGARFSQPSLTVRAIVYSDLAENSNIGAVNGKASAPEEVGKKFGTFFRRSIFYFFGLGTGSSNTSGYLQSAKAFWIPVMASMDAAVGGIGSDLNIPNVIPTASRQLAVTLDRNGQSLFGRAALLTDQEGNLVDSWIGISRLSFTALNGTYQCSSDGRKCNLSAITTGSLSTNTSSEVLEMGGGEANILSGTLGVKGALTFPITAKIPQE